jgi:hypothetical protein
MSICTMSSGKLRLHNNPHRKILLTPAWSFR